MLKKIVCTMSEKDILCNVCIDEMSLTCGLHYNMSKDRIDGFVNMDCGGSQEITKQALVFMATGLVSNWKQPIVPRHRETWAITKSLLSRLDAFVMWIYHTVLKIWTEKIL